MGDLGIGDGSTKRRTDEGMGQVVHSYTMWGDLAGRPGQPYLLGPWPIPGFPPIRTAAGAPTAACWTTAARVWTGAAAWNVGSCRLPPSLLPSSGVAAPAAARGSSAEAWRGAARAPAVRSPSAASVAP